MEKKSLRSMFVFTYGKKRKKKEMWYSGKVVYYKPGF